MKVMIIAGYSKSLIGFRGDMIRAMKSRNHEIVTVGPGAKSHYADKIAKLGADYIQVGMNRTGINPLYDLHTFKQLYDVIKQEEPDMVLAYTAKPIIYGCLAAYLCHVKSCFAMVTGLGSVFHNSSFKAELIKALMKIQYRVALSKCDKVFFQNPDDRDTFQTLHLTKPQQTVIINGSGINIERFQQQPLAEENIFLFIGRLISDKGIIEYMEAARKVKRKYPLAQFLIVGPFDTNPTAIKKRDIDPYIKDGLVKYLGPTDDVRPFLKKCSVFVLPSYHEGTPRSVLEAMATGRPIITTDAPGCRETVVDGVNGFLVPVKDVDALAEKMIWMIEHREEAEKMGQESRRICEEKYDVHKVNKVILDSMNL